MGGRLGLCRALVPLTRLELMFHKRKHMHELSEHIDKEDLGIFPMAVVTLGAAGWDTVTRAHEHSSPRPAAQLTLDNEIA